MASIWRQSMPMKQFSPLNGDRDTEVVVIGGGMAGILTAYFLTKRGVKCMVLEAGRIGGGATGNTTAKVTAQHGLVYADLLTDLGEERARQYADANMQAVERYRSVIREEKIACDFVDTSTILYATEDPAPLQREHRAAEKLGLPVRLTNQTELPFPVKGALELMEQAVFHPLQFMGKLAEHLEIYEGTQALEVEGNTVVTADGTVRAKDIVVATHFPFINAPGYYFLRMHQDRSYTIALQGVGRLSGAYLGIDGDALSLRSHGDLVLLCGSGHRAGENVSGGKYSDLLAAAERLWPGSREVARWSAQDCMPHDRIPLIGKYSAGTDHLYVATGFGKWGMTGSMVAAEALTKAITGEAEVPDVFRPQRNAVRPTSSLKALGKDGIEVAAGLLKEFFAVPNEELDAVPRGGWAEVEYQGETVGAYRDLAGEVHLVQTKCPHLGCHLTWNGDERSWDCPCHGSRFDYRGRRLDGPAQRDLEGER